MKRSGIGAGKGMADKRDRTSNAFRRFFANKISGGSRMNMHNLTAD
jgi:hypothetical protein